MNTVQLPASLIQDLEQEFGGPISLEMISGLSPASVYKMVSPKLVAILKSVLDPREYLFYRDIASVLNSAGASTACLYFHKIYSGIPWILIEYIPYPLPDYRWGNDDQVMSYLATIHSISPKLDKSLAFYPKWTPAMNATALECFDPSVRDSLKKILDKLQKCCSDLFRPLCFISGDPNPRNWGLRADDSLVQYDWKKIGMGSPAIDLSIFICSSENLETCRQVACTYLSYSKNKTVNDFYDEKSLSLDILKGCAWNYVSFLNDYMNKEIYPMEKLVEFIVDTFPAWLKSNFNNL